MRAAVCASEIAIDFVQLSFLPVQTRREPRARLALRFRVPTAVRTLTLYGEGHTRVGDL